MLPRDDTPAHAQARAVGAPVLTALAATITQSPERQAHVVVRPPWTELARVDLLMRDSASQRIFTYLLVASRQGPDAVVEELYGPSVGFGGRLGPSRQATLDAPTLQQHVMALFANVEAARRRSGLT